MLALLPNTSSVAQELAALEEKHARADVIERAQIRLADARQRDTLAAPRPEGCWCRWWFCTT